MQIFSMDTSSAAASCALLEDDRPIAQFYTDARLTHSQTIMPMAQALLECSHKSVQDIDLFAVSVGPGSFTGLRIGVAAVKGMAQVLQKPCVPVSALEGLAFNLYDRAGILCAALDARCGQVYAACFDADNQMARLTDDSALMAEELCEQLSQLPAGRPITVLGDGAQLVQTPCSGCTRNASSRSPASTCCCSTPTAWVWRPCTASRAAASSPFWPNSWSRST